MVVGRGFSSWSGVSIVDSIPGLGCGDGGQQAHSMSSVGRDESVRVSKSSLIDSSLRNAIGFKLVAKVVSSLGEDGGCLQYLYVNGHQLCK